MNELALFAGAGGGILAGEVLGWRCICAVEWEPYPASVLMQRQNDGLLPPFPIWDDVRTFDGRPWRGRVDVVSGGFPCQDISAAGKGAGIEGKRSGMWVEMARIISEVRPRYVFVENSPMLTSRGLGRVLGDLAALGFDAEWGVLGAADVGAPHQRDRIWIVADAKKLHCNGRNDNTGERVEREAVSESGDSSWSKELAETNEPRPQRLRTERQDTRRQAANRYAVPGCTPTERQWLAEPDVDRVVNGLADRVDRIKAIGNGQVPQCAAEAWRILHGRLMDE